MSFFVYVLYSKSFNKIYIGQTNNLENRMVWHNEKASKGYTLKFRPWKIIYFEELDSRKNALIREKQLKSSKGREFIWNEIILKNGLDS